MKELLENYEVLFLLGGITSVSLLMKGISYALYGKLLRESGQMGVTKNQWLKSMMAKFEAYYKLRISVHNVANFVDRYLYHYRFLGISLQSWENAGLYASFVISGIWGLSCLAGGYFRMSQKWFLIMAFVFVALLMLLGIMELLFNTRKCRKLFRIQLIDYMENTMRARLENEYFHQEENEKYQREYFEDEEEIEVAEANVKPEGKSNQQELLKELMNSLMEEMELERDLAGRQLFKGNDSERAQLFDEILKEYI